MAGKYKHLHFWPVVGMKYKSSCFGLRVMVLGESHYRWRNMPDEYLTTIHALTNNCEEKPFWRKIAKLFGHGPEFWDQVLFYNYVQRLLGHSWVSPIDP
jgi:hypothetical protein